MFGKNPIRKRTDNPLELEVESVFNTIQGEGPYAGMPAIFIRLSGCNLACHFCDTEFEEGIGKFTRVEDIVAQVQRYPEHFQNLIVITGGEPLRQNIALLVEMLLHHAGSKTKIVQLETAGTLWDERLTIPARKGELVIVCSPKTPKIAAGIEENCRHWKYVLRCEDQTLMGLPASSTQQKMAGTWALGVPLWQRPLHTDPAKGARQWLPTDTVWVSPCDEHDEDKNRNNVNLVATMALRHGYRVSLQMHKILNLE